MRALENNKRKTYRVAVVVSRKVNKSAVARNRIRRRLYEIVRLLENDILHPFDIVITVFHDTVLEESHKQLKDEVKKQLKDARVLAKRVAHSQPAE